MTLPASLASAPQTARAFLPRPAGRRKVLTARPCAYLKAHVDESVKHTVEQAIAALNKHDPIALCGVLSEKVVWSDRVWSRDDWMGHKKVVKVHRELFTAMPDLRVHAEDVLSRSDSNTVAVHWTATGTNTGEWRGRPATGRRSTFSGVSLFVFDSEQDDRIREVIVYRQPSAEEREQLPDTAA